MQADTLADLGDVPGAPHGPKMSKFHTVYWNIWQNRMLAPPGGLVFPPMGNIGFASATLHKWNSNMSSESIRYILRSQKWGVEEVTKLAHFMSIQRDIDITSQFHRCLIRCLHILRHLLTLNMSAAWEMGSCTLYTWYIHIAHIAHVQFHGLSSFLKTLWNFLNFTGISQFILLN